VRHRSRRDHVSQFSVIIKNYKKKNEFSLVLNRLLCRYAARSLGVDVVGLAGVTYEQGEDPLSDASYVLWKKMRTIIVALMRGTYFPKHRTPTKVCLVRKNKRKLTFSFANRFFFRLLPLRASLLTMLFPVLLLSLRLRSAR
jgi:hypothetical protein